MEGIRESRKVSLEPLWSLRKQSPCAVGEASSTVSEALPAKQTTNGAKAVGKVVVHGRNGQADSALSSAEQTGARQSAYLVRDTRPVCFVVT
jgi:hypothetical protein